MFINTSRGIINLDTVRTITRGKSYRGEEEEGKEVPYNLCIIEFLVEHKTAIFLPLEDYEKIISELTRSGLLITIVN